MLNSKAAEHAVILQYHHISDSTPAITSTSPELFLWQVNYLHEQGYQILPLTKVIDAIQRKQQLPSKSVVLTFDDSYESIYSNAYPILKEKNWPFAIFIDTDGVGKNKMHLNWQQIREMKANGAEILNHSHSHTHFVRQQSDENKQQWLQRIRKEINLAQSIIKRETGSDDKIIAYPFGEYSLEIIDLIESMGFVGVGQQSGPFGYNMPDSIVPRYPMGAYFGKPASFMQKLNTLPMPLKNYPKVEPVQLQNFNPALALDFKLDNEGQKRKLLNQFQCYFGANKTNISWSEIDNKALTANVRATNNIPIARSRYNCTLPVKGFNPEVTPKEDVNNKTYYWYSQLWIRPKKVSADYHEIHWYNE
ncbi:MAG: polysaccharide deacetylase family protein [Gammaproteobacteria bacterium]|nr:polysaccharide deacetylase family protein [Gammaproteobacteria bacterium]